jgi:hypothetical protein
LDWHLLVAIWANDADIEHPLAFIARIEAGGEIMGAASAFTVAAGRNLEFAHHLFSWISLAMSF